MAKEDVLNAIDAVAVEAARAAALPESHLLRNIIYYAVDDHHVAALFKEADFHIDHVRQGLPDHPYP